MAEPVKAFVAGHPVAHSRSPLLHGYWLEHYGIDGSYEARDVPPADFPAFLRSFPDHGFAGGNVTLPHKEAAFTGADRRDGAAEAIGAANTLWLEDGRLVAGNTDAYGFAANLDHRAPGWRESETALVIGAGGAARSVVHALAEAGIADIRVANRTFARAEALAARFPAMRAEKWDRLNELLGRADLLVNTTSLGMAGQGPLDIDVERLPDTAVVADIVYVPLVTPLLHKASARDLTAVDGLGMLLHQAVPGFERWFGRRPEVTDELRRRIEADLGGRTGEVKPT